MDMTIKATSAEHATMIFEELRSKGYTYRMSYLNMQEWVHPELETVIAGLSKETIFQFSTLQK